MFSAKTERTWQNNGTGLEGCVSTSIDHVALDRAIDGLFAADKKRPCAVGTELLRTFAHARPVDFGFVEPRDLIDARNCAFTGIAEWDRFAEHFATCERCDV